MERELADAIGVNFGVKPSSPSVARAVKRVMQIVRCTPSAPGGVTRDDIAFLAYETWWRGEPNEFDWYSDQYPEDKAKAYAVADANLARLQSAREDERAHSASLSTTAPVEAALSLSGEEERPITMQDVRLRVGEGKLRPEDVLAGCNAELAARARLSPRSGEEERKLREAIQDVRRRAMSCADLARRRANEGDGYEERRLLAKRDGYAYAAEMILAALRHAGQGEEAPR